MSCSNVYLIYLLIVNVIRLIKNLKTYPIMISVLHNSYDYLYLHNGLSEGNQSIGELTGHIATGSLFASTGNALYVRFSSDTSLKLNGFNIQYQSGITKSVKSFKVHSIY